MLGGTMVMFGQVLVLLKQFATAHGKTHRALFGSMNIAEALFQTVGVMIIAASDVNYDQFAKRNPRCVFAFALLWFVVTVLSTLAPPIDHTMFPGWAGAIPFIYLLLRFRAVLQMHSWAYPRFSDLFAYTLCLSLIDSGVSYSLQANPVYGAEGYPAWPWYIVGINAIFSGGGLFVLYRDQRSKYSHSLALSVTLYGYLLAWGFISLARELANQYSNHLPTPLTIYSFPIIHITLPLGYFACRPLIFRSLGHHWLRQRKYSVEFHATCCLEERGNLVEVETAITAKADLNAFVFSTDEDEFTLLHLAVLNEHYDSVQRLLQTGEVQANKPSGSKGRTAMFLAAEVGRLDALVLLLEQAADVDVLADDRQSPLIVATANGHTKVVALLREHGANEHHKWMGLKGNCSWRIFD
jgi:hypothetical protein